MNLTLCVVIMRHFKNKKIYGITFNLLFVARIRDVGLSMFSLNIYIFKRKKPVCHKEMAMQQNRRRDLTDVEKTSSLDALQGFNTKALFG